MNCERLSIQNAWYAGTLNLILEVQKIYHHNEVNIIHEAVIVCFGELLLANLDCVSLNFLELSLKKKITIFAFFICKIWHKIIMIPFARDEKDIGSHLNYFTGTLVYVPLSNVSLNKALDLIDCYSSEKPRYCSVGICAP